MSPAAHPPARRRRGLAARIAPLLIAVTGGALPIGAAPPAAAETAPADGDSARQYHACVLLTQRAPKEAMDSALAWRDGGGGFAARHCLALALTALGQHARAGEELERLALDMKGEGAERQVAVLAQAANAWLLAGQHGRARDILTTALALRPDDVDLLIDRGRAHAALSDYAAAFADLDRAVALDPARADALALRAAARRRTGDTGRALEDAEMALAIEPANPEALLERGMLRQRAGDRAGARADFLKVATEHVNSPAGDQAQALIEALDLKAE